MLFQLTPIVPLCFTRFPELVHLRRLLCTSVLKLTCSACSVTAMMKRARVMCRARVVAFNPWKQRPGGLSLHGRPQMVNPHFFRGDYRRQNPDDPTRLLSPSHVILKRCPLCRRTRFVKLNEKDHFHTCCEGTVMKILTNMKTVMNAEQKLLTTTRQWDVENERPWCNGHRPRPKGRSKFKK